MKTATMNAPALTTARVGSISEGTLRTEDLLSAFLSELEGLVLLSGDYFSRPENFDHRDRLNNLAGEAQDCFAEDGEEIQPDKEDTASELVNETLPNALQEFAPPYCYFGAHPGDGADYGFWPSIEQIEELPTVEDSDAAGELGEDCKSVNDHGNVTVYGGDGSILLELV
jgi:hypothetical protein